MLCNQKRKEIIFRFLATDPRVVTFLFESPEAIHLRASSRLIIDSLWDLNDEQRLLVRVALDIWDGSGHVSVGEALRLLSNKNFQTLLIALRKYRRTANFHSFRHSRP